MTLQQCASLARAEAQKVQEDLGWILAVVSWSEDAGDVS